MTTGCLQGPIGFEAKGSLDLPISVPVPSFAEYLPIPTFLSLYPLKSESLQSEKGKQLTESSLDQCPNFGGRSWETDFQASMRGTEKWDAQLALSVHSD